MSDDYGPEFNDELLEMIDGATQPADSPPAQEAPSAPPPAPEVEPEAEVQETEVETGGNPPNADEATPKMVPYDRLQEVIGERNTLRQEAEGHKQGREVLDSLLSGNRESWTEAIRRGLVPQDVLQQYAVQQVPAAAPTSGDDLWAESEAGTLTAAQVTEIARQQNAAANQPLVQALQGLLANQARSNLKQTFGQDYDPARDDALIQQVSFKHPTLTPEEAFRMSRTYVAPAKGPAPPEASRGQVQKPAASGRSTQSERKAETAAARLNRIGKTRGREQLGHLSDLIENM